MKRLELDIKQSPPTTQHLAERRKHLSDRLQQLSKRKKQLGYLAYAIGLTGLCVVLALWKTGIITGEQAAFAVVFAVAVAGAATHVVAFAFDWLDTRRRAAQTEFDSLLELESSEFPQECLDFVAWCEADPTLAQYQHQLVSMNRKPVTGEYTAAKAWINSVGERQSEEELQEKAREACERMRRPIQVVGGLD